ncbi:hypothetical protein J437_LFUL018320 [Ladona fulva]|uniref:Uncharacterized protein n=1 Tax=Ladona fulva TaxID=123851 RepID=A0A8K0KNS1_LADFU|nr:hypothetical protein J437_LFUL018320 [Ladona fulva]
MDGHQPTTIVIWLLPFILSLTENSIKLFWTVCASLKKEILKITRKWGLEGKVVAVVSDNAANKLPAAGNLGWKHIPSFAHTLNLLVQNSLTEFCINACPPYTDTL